MTKRKVYLVQEYDYVLGVFTSRNEASAYCARYKATQRDQVYAEDALGVSAWTLNAPLTVFEPEDAEGPTGLQHP